MYQKCEVSFHDLALFSIHGRLEQAVETIHHLRNHLAVHFLKSGQLSGYAGDVWFPQPAPNDHVWRTMPNHGMTPHTSGTSLSAQARYADGVREILECFFEGKEIRNQYLICLLYTSPSPRDR